MKPTALSLCSGIGGLDLAFAAAGFDIVCQIEWDAYCCKVLNKWKSVYWPNSEITQADLEDVYHEWNIEPGTIDALFGGIPCQPYSHAGKREGQDDDRNLWPATIEIVRQLHPRVVVIENVAGIITLALDDIRSDLEGENYTAETFVFPASAIGASHKRDRAFIVAYANSLRHGQSHVARGQGTSDGKRHDTSQKQPGQYQLCKAVRSRKNLAYTTDARFQAWQHAGYRPDAAQRLTGMVAKLKRHCIAGTGADRVGTDRPVSGSLRETVAAQSELGRTTDGLSEWLDGYTFPSRPGITQHDWEEPRVRNTREVSDRTHRLKALGNAVVPQQAYPVAKAVMNLLQSK